MFNGWKLYVGKSRGGEGNPPFEGVLEGVDICNSQSISHHKKILIGLTFTVRRSLGTGSMALGFW
jgi:hypothetical protein